MANMQRSLPYPLNARSLWHWAYFNGRDSVMAKAVDTATLGINSSPGGAMSGNWKKTKAARPDFGGHSDSSAQIWTDQQKQHIRSLIHQLPFYARALGNVLYLPAGDTSEQDLNRVHDYLYKKVVRAAAERFPGLKPERRSRLYDLSYCALCHYFEAISPSIDGQTPRSMAPKAAEVGKLMKSRGNAIETRYWSKEWRPLWMLIIDEVRAIDEVALAPLDEWAVRYFSVRTQECVGM